MFRITKDPPSGSDKMYFDGNYYTFQSVVTHTHTHTPQVQNMPPNTDQAHDKYL